MLSGTVIPAAALANVAEPWAVIVQRWIDSQLSNTAKDGYRREEKAFTTWCADVGLDPCTARRHDIDAYRNARTAMGDSARTVARRLSAISSLFTYGGSLGLPANPVTGVKRRSTTGPVLRRSHSPAVKSPRS